MKKLGHLQQYICLFTKIYQGGVVEIDPKPFSFDGNVMQPLMLSAAWSSNQCAPLSPHCSGADCYTPPASSRNWRAVDGDHSYAYQDAAMHR